VTPELEAIAERVTEPLRDFCSAPRTRAEVLDWLEQEHGVPNDGSNGIWYAIRLRARIAHSAAASRWRAPIHNPNFVALEQDEEDGEAARAELVRRYLAAFGPATRAEIAGWSGMKVGRFAHLLDGLRTFRDGAPTRPRRCACCRSSTTSCSTANAFSPTSTARSWCARTRTSSRPSR